MQAQTPTPTLDEFRRLYEATLAFKTAAPWQWMMEEQVFGIREPESGRIGYASVMGNLGEHLALAVYMGTEGLVLFGRLSSGELDENPDLFFEAYQLQASFEDREELTDQDRQVIKQLGLKFRGHQAWPLFRSFLPGYVPWYVTPEEARFLTVALVQALDVAVRLRENESLLAPPAPGQFLVRVQAGENWTDEWLAPEPYTVLTPPVLREEAAAALRQELPQKSHTLQVDLFTMAHIRGQEDPRPYFGYTLLVMEPKSEMIVGGEVLAPEPSLAEMKQEVPKRLLDIVAKMGARPRSIAVRNQDLKEMIEPLAKQLGIQVKVARQMAVLDRARRMMERFV